MEQAEMFEETRQQVFEKQVIKQVYTIATFLECCPVEIAENVLKLIKKEELNVFPIIIKK